MRTMEEACELQPCSENASVKVDMVATGRDIATEMPSPGLGKLAEKAFGPVEMGTELKNVSNEMQLTDVNRAIDNVCELQPCSENASVQDEMLVTLDDNATETQSPGMGKLAEKTFAPQEMGTDLKNESSEMQPTDVNRAKENTCELQPCSENASVQDENLMIVTLEDSVTGMQSSGLGKLAEKTIAPEEMGTELKNESNEMEASHANRTMENVCELQLCSENAPVQDENLMIVTLEDSVTGMQSSGLGMLAEKTIAPEEMGTELKNESNEMQASHANRTMENVCELQLCSENAPVQDDMVATGQNIATGIPSSSMGKLAEKTIAPEEIQTELKNKANEMQASDTNREMENVCELQPCRVNASIQDEMLPTLEDNATKMPSLGMGKLAEKTIAPEEMETELKHGSNEMQASDTNREMENVCELQPCSENASAQDEMLASLEDSDTEMQSSGLEKLAERTIVPEEMGTELKNGSNETKASDVNRAMENVCELQPCSENVSVQDENLMLVTLEDSATGMQSSGKLSEKTIAPQEMETELKNESNEMQPTDVNRTKENTCDLQCCGENASVQDDMVATRQDIATGISSSSMGKLAEKTIAPEEMGTELKNESNETQATDANRAMENVCELQPCSENASQDEILATLEDSATEMPSPGIGKLAEKTIVPEEMETELKRGSNEMQATEYVNRANENTCELQPCSENASAQDENLMLATLDGSATETQSFSIGKLGSEEMDTKLKNGSTDVPSGSVNRSIESASELLPSCVTRTVANDFITREMALTSKEQSNEMQISGVNGTVKNTIEMQPSSVSNIEQNALVTDVEDSNFNNKSQSSCSKGINEVSTEKQFICTSTASEDVNVQGESASFSTEMYSFGLNISEKTASKLESSDKTMGDCEDPTVSPITVHKISEKTVAMTISCVADYCLSEETDSADSEDSFVSSITADSSVLEETALTAIPSSAAVCNNMQVENSTTECYSESLLGWVSLPTRSESFEETNQPPRKKIKLDEGITVPVKDILDGMHTILCGRNCTSKHNPLVLAVGAADDCKMRASLENHFKLSIKNGWQSSTDIEDPSSVLCHVVVQMAVLSGKCDLLEFMLEAHPGTANVFGSVSPLFIVLRNMNHFMPSSSFDDKVESFRQMLTLLAKYDCNLLLAQDVSCKETFLHLCAKRIRDLTNEIKGTDSSTTDISQLEELLSQRRLCEQFFSEMIRTFQKLCVDGHFHQSSVLELLDCKNLSGETISDILDDEKSIRNESNFSSQTSSPVSEEGISQNTRKQVTFDARQVGRRDKEGALSLTTATEIPILSQTSDPQSNHQTVYVIPDVDVPTNEVNSSETTTLSTNAPSVQKLSAGTSGSASSTVSVSLSSPQTAKTGISNAILCASTNEVNPTGTTTFSTSSPSAQRLSGVASGSVSSIVSVSMQSSQTTITGGRVDRMSGVQRGSPAAQMNAETTATSTGYKVKGKHTFLCNPNCGIQHHELIQLLCATPDHTSLMLPAEETETCSNFRNYLKHTSWDLSAVVFDPMPKLCYSIIHLACLLGKYKALEVLSEFGFHALIHTAITEETPLHMTVHLLNYQSSGGLFLYESVVSILKILNRHSHAISLFAAKDYRGNTVLHLLANLLSPKKCSIRQSAAVVCLFRVFVRFLLRGCNSSPALAHKILSSTLLECNKKGESIETMLKQSAVGNKLLTYMCPSGLTERSSEGIVLNPSSLDDESQCSPSGHNEPDETESLADLLVSSAGQFTDAGGGEIRMLAERYCREYQQKERFLQQKVQSLVKEIMSEKKHLLKSAKGLDRALAKAKSSIEWTNCRVQTEKDQLQNHERQHTINGERALLLEELQQDFNQWQSDHPGTIQFF